MKTLASEIVTSLPSPLFDAYQVFINEDEKQPFRKVHRLIDLIEVFCKFYTVGSMATFLFALREQISKEQNALSEEAFTKIKVMLATGLKTPSLGIWWMFARDITKILQELKIPHILPGAEMELLNGKSKIKSAFDGDNNLIAFRNNYAHGATPKDTDCKKDLELYWPRMLQILTDAVSLRAVQLVICSDDKTFFTSKAESLRPITIDLEPLPGHIWFCSNNTRVDVFPILSFKYEENKIDFYFYNDYKDTHANYLNYPQANHFKNVKLKEELLKTIPIDDWKKIGAVDMDPFRQQVEMLTEVFKGRKEELNTISSFLTNESNRFLCIWGPPGVGKSALLARTAQILRCSPEIRETIESGVNWPENKLFLVEFFIRRGATETAAEFFDSLNTRLDILFKLRFELGKSDKEKQTFFLMRLQQIAKQLKTDERLLLVADGLDEIKVGDPLLSLLPKQLPEKIQMIYGARPQQELRFSFYEQLDRERRTDFVLGGLSLADIRAVMMEHVSKYEMQQLYIDEVLKISEGNPLYLKLLCSGLEQNIYKLNSASTLPKGMDELYENALMRLEKEFSGAVNFLLYLAAAKDFVSPELAAVWIKTPLSILRNQLISACLEFLYENPLTESLEDYQLFHESLREYLSKKYVLELQECKERICDWAAAWKLTNGDVSFSDELLTYAMQFSTEHLFESHLLHKSKSKEASAKERRTQLFELTENINWRVLNFETCGNGDAIGRSYFYLQRILSKEDSKGILFQDFTRYAFNRYAEPERMYLGQRQTLLQPVKREQLAALFERTPSLAKMGQRDEDKVLLALLPIWSNEHNGKLPAQLEGKITDWLENTRNTAVKKLWLQTQSKRLN